MVHVALTIQLLQTRQIADACLYGRYRFTLCQINCSADGLNAGASVGRLSALEGVLKEKLTGDQGFAALLDRLVREAREFDTNQLLLVGERNISVAGNATGVFITGDSNQITKE